MVNDGAMAAWTAGGDRFEVRHALIYSRESRETLEVRVGEWIPVDEFRLAHKALGHLVVGMPRAPGGADGPAVPAWAKCLDCMIVVDDAGAQ